MAPGGMTEHEQGLVISENFSVFSPSLVDTYFQ